MSDLMGNRAVKINAGQLTNLEEKSLFSREGFVYYNLLNVCDAQLNDLAKNKNIDLLEYNALFSSRCAKYEKLYFEQLRASMRKKIHDDEIREITGNYHEVYHPYNPYMQKFNRGYLRSYQKF